MFTEMTTKFPAVSNAATETAAHNRAHFSGKAISTTSHKEKESETAVALSGIHTHSKRVNKR